MGQVSCCPPRDMAALTGAVAMTQGSGEVPLASAEILCLPSVMRTLSAK